MLPERCRVYAAAFGHDELVERQTGEVESPAWEQCSSVWAFFWGQDVGYLLEVLF